MKKIMVLVVLLVALFAAPAAAFAQDAQPPVVPVVQAQITCEHQFFQVQKPVQNYDAYVVIVYDYNVRIVHPYLMRENDTSVVWMADMFVDGFVGQVEVLYGSFGGYDWPAQTINICTTPEQSNAGYNAYLPAIIYQP